MSHLTKSALFALAALWLTLFACGEIAGDQIVGGEPSEAAPPPQQPLDDLIADGASGVGMAVTVLGYLIILGGFGVAAWFVYKRGLIGKPFSKGEGKLRIAETRMLGNRQFIMVVEYEDQKILLGVGPGKIDYLTTLSPGLGSGSFPAVEPEPQDLKRQIERQLRGGGE